MGATYPHTKISENIVPGTQVAVGITFVASIEFYDFIEHPLSETQ